jgi:uncharacterized protein (DUF3084 family)
MNRQEVEDEVERLRAELAAAQGNADDNYKKLMECRAELAAERERFATLRAAYDKLRNKPVQLVGSDATIAKLSVALELSRRHVGQSDGLLADRIDAVLEETKGDEK